MSEDGTATKVSLWKLNHERHLRFHDPKRLWQRFAWNSTSKVVCALFLCTSKLVGNVMNSTRVFNEGQFLDLLDERKNRGLLTVSNHTSRLDDPLVWSMLRWRQLINFHDFRWSTAAEDVCFKHPYSAFCMAVGKVLPLRRKPDVGGVYQETMDFCVNELDKGKWVHIFPEGKINLEQKAMRLKWGVGRLIADAHVTPLVLLMHHIGFEKIFPNEGPLFPRLGQKSSVYIGQPIDFSSKVLQLRQQFKSQTTEMAEQNMRKCLTDIIEQKMAHLKTDAETFHRKVYQIGEDLS